MYSLHGGNKKSVSPYKSLTGGNTFCKAECDNDPDCNGYSINSTGCFIARCNTYLDIPGCKSPSSNADYSQTSATPQSTTMISQLVTTTGNDVTELTTYNLPCVCVCKKVNQTIGESIQKRRSELLMNKTKLSSAMGNWHRLMITRILHK